MATTKVTTDVIDMSGNAGGLTWVTGTTVQQPSGVIGEIREDTDTNRTLVYTDETGTAEWRNLKEAAVVGPSFNVEYLVVAGGGGGGGNLQNGNQSSGGGGAGGYLTNVGGTSLSLSPSTPYTLTVGPAGQGGISNTQRSANGLVSTFSGSFTGSPITSSGGGSGSMEQVGSSARDGGSGGGGSSLTNAGGSANPSGQGNAGATSGTYGFSGGGGGGAGTAGVGGLNGTGGTGLQNAITVAIGTGPYYAGGGGGSRSNNGSAGAGGAGGGGAGSSNNGTGGTNGTHGFGGGGGGAYGGGSNGGRGGDGIVILRCTKATATLGSGITVNSTAGPGSVNGVLITDTSDYHYSATAGTGTITFS
jgi:hypothetical protein